ncbi:facilitated trehalose transporter Tret1-like [Diachasma alloeum]|uniref:facilitated trehalose transporter Tret1-like n=1 Tax=Diachasma alloeum TaxID=454923 RepID=UPI0007382142|nr:facilitated trehalose transporter Tret1-like [Diachasma alloeum]
MIGCDNLSLDLNKWRQIVAAVIANLAAVTGGMLSSWISPVGPRLMEEDTPVGTEPITEDEISILSSATGLMSLFALIFYALSAGKISTKIQAWIIAMSGIGSWVLILFAQNFYYLLIARILAGVVCGLTFSMMPVYVTEIAEDSIRGALGSLLSFGVNIGVFLAFILGATLSYRDFAVCGLIVPVVFIVGFVFLPESPAYFMRKGLVDNATRSLMWLRNNDQSAVDRDLKLLEKQFTPDSIKTAGLKHLFRDRGTIKTLIISITLYAGQHFGGYAIIFSYTGMIFEQANKGSVAVSADDSLLVLAGIQIIGSLIPTFTIDHLGRRKLIISSCAGISTFHAAFGIYLLLQSREYDLSSVAWIPLAAVSGFGLVYCAGLGPGTSIVTSECFGPDIVSLGISISLATEFISNFLTTLAFPFVSSHFGMHVSFFILAACPVVTMAIIFFILPETKGKSKVAISEELNRQAKKGDNHSLNLNDNGIGKNVS